jgi:hypothetical protein
MLAVKGYYRNREITLLEPLPDNVHEAELNIVVLPKETKAETLPSAKRYEARKITSEEEFKDIGLSAFFETDDDADVDWEDCFGLK